jgi:hypothetical protein
LGPIKPARNHALKAGIQLYSTMKKYLMGFNSIGMLPFLFQEIQCMSLPDSKLPSRLTCVPESLCDRETDYQFG